MSVDDNNVYSLSIADAMAAMMLIFTLVLVVLMLRQGSMKNKDAEISGLHSELTHYRQTAGNYFDMREKIYTALVNEFFEDLKKWNARIDKGTLAFILENSENGFDTGKADIPLEFQTMLNQFVPRYLNVIRNFKESVYEIRIEGHTSSEWSNKLPECQIDANSEPCKKSIYLKNMGLSQDRAMSVLNHILLMDTIQEVSWVRSKMTAIGLSSSHLLCGEQKVPCSGQPSEQENREASRRVEFSIRTDAESQIKNMQNTQK